MKKSIILLAFILIFAGLFAESAKAAEDESVFGINVGMELRYEQGEEATIIARLDELGIDWAREEFNWNVIETTQGNFDWNGYDRIMDRYEAANVNVLGVLAYSADWASTGPTLVTNLDKYAPDSTHWHNFVTAVVSRYPDIEYWEIWNEQNNQNFLIADDSVAAYKSILETASSAIRAVNPNDKVVLGGLSGADVDFMRRLYLTGAKDLFDIVAIHPYRTNFNKNIYAPELTQFGMNNLATDLYMMRSMIQAYDPFSPAPIWITEIGWPTHEQGVTEKEQGDYLQRAFITSHLYPQVEKIFWYNLRDDVATDDEDKNYGLYDYEWYAKPAASAFQQLSVNYPTLTMREDHEAWAKPVEEFEDASRFSLEVHDDGIFVSSREVANHPAVKAFRGLDSITFNYSFWNNTTPQYRKVVISDAPRSWYSTYDLWLWSDGGIHPVRMRFKDINGEIFQGNAGYTGYGWTRLNLSLTDVANNFVNWGGDGAVDYPVVVDSIIIEKNPYSPIFEGEIILSRLTYRRFDQAYSYRFQQNGRNVWVYWKMDGHPEPASVYSPLSRRMLIWNLRDWGYRYLDPIDMPGRDVIMFGLEKQPLFIL
ncbi:beta-galactosidase [Patescibacteria group bacterium]|nr:beta-galactosidase [Patescibacteria group bacterium]MBU0964556.1 beta-galactosidase [Patescibacteria group bacterium]